jgi:hypothetical protein
MTDTAESRWESHNEAGRRAFRQGDHAAAEQEFIAAIREGNALGENDARLAASLAGLAQIKSLQRDFQQAEALFKRALAIRERALGDKHPDVAATLNSLARLYFHSNDHVAAAPLLMRLLAIKQEALGAHHPEVAVILTSLAKVRLAEHQYEDAEQLARRALLIREEIHKPTDPAVAMSLDTLADILAARGQLEEEQRLRKRIEQIRGGAGARENPREGGAPAAPRGQTQPIPPAPPPPQSPPAPPESRRTTRSASLPWIEAPTSPALRRPAPRPFSTTSQTPAPPATASAPNPTPATRPAAPQPAQRNTPRFAAQYTPPASRPPERRISGPRGEPVTGKVRSAIVQPTPARRDPGADSRRDSRREVFREAQRERERERYDTREVVPRRRSPFGMVAAALLVIGGAGGAWIYFSGARVTSSAGAALDSPALEGGAGGVRPLDEGSPAASSDPSYGVQPPVRRRPPEGAYVDAPPANVDRLPDRSATASDTPGGTPTGVGSAAASPLDSPSADTASPLEPSALVLPAANVDRITAAIGENARAKADSLGRKTITVKPPDFKKP